MVTDYQPAGDPVNPDIQLTVWKFVGGRACLDFVNTVGGRARAGVLRDKLRSYLDLVSWAEAAGLLPREMHRFATHDRRPATAVLARAIALREALYHLFSSARDSAALAILNRELAISRRHERLHRGRTGFLWQWDDAPALDRILWPVARSAAELLVSPDAGRVRVCDGENCGWLFLDTSRNRSRHWCDMRDCGNRAKVQRFRERRSRSTG